MRGVEEYRRIQGPKEVGQGVVMIMAGVLTDTQPNLIAFGFCFFSWNAEYFTGRRQWVLFFYCKSCGGYPLTMIASV